MATITFSGLSGSGLDTSSWVDALVSVKQTTITSLQAQQEAQQKLLSVVNNIKSFFSSFQTCLQKITDSQFGIASLDLFMQNLATSSNTNILTATATTDAARQTYDVLVEQLATSTKATSGYTKTETKNATLDTTLGDLGAKSGTITVNNQSFTISEKDTIKDLIGKFSNAGVVASFDSKKCRFTVGAKISDINDGTTGLKTALGLQNTQISGITSGSIVYANKDAKFSALGLTAGKININGAEHNIQKSGTNYTIQKAGGTKVNINTINDFLNVLKTNYGAEATIDDKGNISIRGCVIESVAGGSNLKDVLNLGDVKERTVMKSNALTWQKTNVADYSTTLKNLGITGNKTLKINNGTATNIADTTTLQSLKNTLATSGIDMSVDENGIITVDTNGKTVSGTLLDALGLVADKSGTTLRSNAHTVTYKATGSTKLSDLGLTNTDTYTAYKSDGTAITGSLNNVAGLTIDEFVAQLKTKGLDASFDNNTQQIIINDGFILGLVAYKLGMTRVTEYHQEAATVDTTLAKLGATDKQNLTINGGTAKEYEKTAKLSDVIKDITDAGGTVELKDGTMKVSGVTLTGTLPALLGFSATTQGTSVTSGALSVVTNSSSTSSSAVQETQNNQIALTTKLGTILGLTSGSRTLAINGGTSVSYDVTSKTLNDVKTAIETAGGTFTINDDNTISVSGVTLSGTLVTALGLASVGSATSMTSNRAITIGGVENPATTTNTLADLGATGNTTISINGGTAKTYNKTATLSTVFSDIAAAGGTAEIKDGVVTVSGVNLSGTVVNLLGLQATQTGTEITSGNLTYTASTTSTSSSALAPVETVPITASTTLSKITGAATSTSYTSSIAGTSKNYTGATSLSTIKTDIATAGGTMTIDSDGKITITGVNVSGGIVGALGLSPESTSTTISSNTPITLEQSFLVEGSNTIGADLGVAADKRSYAIYDNYGNVIAETSDTGATGNATVSQWLASVNTKMNTYYGTTNVEYAKISNGVISVNNGYIKGDLASAIGMTTTSTVSGKALVGNAIQIKENSKFIGQVTDQTIPEGGQRVKDVSSFTAGKTYYLSDVDDITNLASLVNSGKDTTGVTFVMANDIDMYGTTLTKGIGQDSSTPFKGTFLGNGYEIKNLSYEANTGSIFFGLFGHTDGATIKDLGLSNVTISNYGYATNVGALIGKANNTTIENCYVSGGSINHNKDVKTSSFVGGLVGDSQDSSINNCFSSIDINVGGKSDTQVNTGGLVGQSMNSSISNSYSLGNITQSTVGTIGGFVGISIDNSINNCYSMGNVKSTSTSNNTIGGFVGLTMNTITNAYATGKVETAYEGSTANIGGFAGSISDSSLLFSTNCAYNRDSGTVNNGAGYTDQNGAIGYSLAQINAEGNGLPKLTGNNPYIYRGINTNTTLAKLGLSSVNDRTITVNIDGVESTNTFDSSAKIQDVLDYLNGLSGVNATFENAQFKISANTTKNISVNGKLATTLFGDSITETNVYETHNTNDKLYYSTGTSAITTATRVGDLLKTNASGNLSVMIDDTTQITLSYDADATVGDILTELSSYGINATISTDGKFQATSSKKIVMSGDISRALIGANGTVTYTDNGYTSAPLTITQNMNLNGDTKLSDLGIDSGNIQILNKSGNLITNLDIDNSKTLSQLSSVLSAYGFTTTIDSTNKKVTITSDNGNRLANSSSNLVSQLKLNTWTDTTDKITNTTTLAEMGFNNGSTMTVVLDGTTTMNLSFGANNTIDDIITALGSFGIDASIVTGTTGNTFSATSNSHSFVLSGEVASYLTQGGTYVNQDIGYKSNPLTYNTSTTPLKADTTIADLLGGHEGGTLRLTLDGNVINLNYNADDTVQNVINDLANLGINATISNTGVFAATSNDKTFVFSGDIGRALQGNAPIYTQLDKEYKSKDLSYNTTSNITNNSILKDIGITSGSIFLLDRNGNVINTIDIDENMTINQTKAALKSYGVDMSLTDGKVTISSNDGYSLTDGSSNMISKFKLPAFTKTTAKLSSGTTLAQMGFKDGADLNLLLDGSTPTTISFGATDTMQDIMNSLQALGINCSINATNGAFTATSTEHSFVFSGDLGKFLTTGTAGYVNTDKGYITDPLMVDVPVVTNTSKQLSYSHALKTTDTVESMGFADGGVVRLILDGTTPYSFSFLATDTMQDIIDTLATYGIDSTIDADGKISFKNNDHTFTLGGELGTYLTKGGTYTNNATGYTSSPLTFKTTENCDDNTKLSDLGASSGALNIIKDGQVAATIQIDADTTIGQLKNAIKPYGMIGTIGADNKLTITSEGDTYLADGTCDAVTKLGLNVVNMGDYDGHVEYWQAGATSGLLTEDMLLTSLDKNGKTAVGSLIFELGTGDDKTQHIVNISATDTIKSFLDKMEAEGVHAVLDNGVIKFDNSVDGIKFTGGSSGISDTLGLTTKQVSTYSTSSRALTYQEDVTYSVANYADKDTLLSTVNVTSGKMSIFVDGVKAEVQVNETDKFSDVFSRIVSQVAAKTGVTVRAGFVDTDGNIVTNPADKNTGIIGIEVVGDHSLVVGASNDTTNFATIANLKQQTPERVAGSRALYKVNGNSLITTAGLFKNGDITEGTFTIGDATFTIDGTTTLNSLINQINKSDKSYASAYWDTLSGTLVVQSTLSGESLINIESGTSNFTKVMGFTESVAGKETLVTERQTLGQNAIVKINGTTVTSTSNTITSDISKIKGLTINLKGVSAGETVTIKVEQDNEGIYNAVNDIVDSYNTLMEGLEKELGDGGSFEHDTMFSMMKNQLKRLMTQSVGGTTTYRNLAAIGISTGAAKDSISTDVTKLLIDKDKFMQALEKDSDAVKQLLVGTTTNSGVFLKVGNIVDSTLKTTGYIASTENSINKNIKKMSTKITSLKTALDKYREQLETKFRTMEKAISNMQSSYSSFLKS